MSQDLINRHDCIEQWCICDVEKIAENFPFHAISILCTTIEVFGKCIHPEHGFDSVKTSEEDFNYAIDHLDAFKKYRNIPFNMYTQVRCAFAHTMMPNGNIKFSPDSFDKGSHTIGCRELLDDVKKAWEEVNTKPIATQRLGKKAASVEGGVTGGTPDLSSKYASH